MKSPNEILVGMLADEPIDSPEADILGYEQIARSLADLIDAQPNSGSLTLGLDGAWGSGKSSIMALLKKALGEAPGADGIGTVVVHFSPWLVTNRTALVAAFFGQLSAAIDLAEKRIPRSFRLFKKHTSRTLLSAKKKLNGFSNIVSIASAATSVLDPSLASTAIAGGSRAIEKLTRDSGKGKTLEALKAELAQALSEVAAFDPSFRILITIDDLDRLDPDDTLEILRLVKAVGDFPATVYLLAYDRRAVAQAIQHSAKIENGDLYLEKIVQFSIKVPPLEPFQLRNWLKFELERLFPGRISYETSSARAVLDAWAGRLLRTPRDVKRLLFAVQSIWPKLSGRVDLLDLLWLQMLAQKASAQENDLYSWVVGYLQGLEAIAIGGMVSGRAEEEQQLGALLSSMGWMEYEHSNERSSMDFHYLDEMLAGVTSSYLSKGEGGWIYHLHDSNLQSFREQKRLSSPWHWRLYFAFDPPSHAITDDEWTALFDAAARSVGDLGKSISDILEFRAAQRSDAADQMLARLMYLLSNAALGEAARWLLAIIAQSGSMVRHSKPDFLGFSKAFDINLRAFSRAVFKKIEAADRKAILREIFSREETLDASANLVRDLFHASKKEGYDRDEQFYLTDEEFDEVSKMQLSLYKKISPEDLRGMKDPLEVLYAWQNLSGSDVAPKRLLTQAFSDDGEFLETLESLRYVNSSSQNGIPRLVESYLKSFVDVKAIKQRLRDLASADGELSQKASRLLNLWWGAED